MNTRFTSFNRRTLFVAFAGCVLLVGVIAGVARYVPDRLATDEEATLSAMARQYLQDRADRVTNTPVGRASLTTVPTTLSLKERFDVEAVQLDRQRERVEAVNGGYRFADVRVEVKSVAVKSAQVSVTITEHTKLYFARTTPGAPAYEAYELKHSLAFSRTAVSWQLEEARAELGPGPAPVAQVVQ